MNVIEQMLEKIVNSWVGCEYKAVDETLDIGEVLRKQFTEVLTALKAVEANPVIDRLEKLISDACESATLERMSVAFPHERIRIEVVHFKSEGGEVGEFVHPDDYIKKMVALHHSTWIVRPLREALCLLKDVRYLVSPLPQAAKEEEAKPTLAKPLQWQSKGKHHIYGTVGNEFAQFGILEHSVGPAGFEVYMNGDGEWRTLFWHGNIGHCISRNTTKAEAMRAAQNHADAVVSSIASPLPQAAQPVGEWNAAIEALEVYANPKNWICDNRGIARIWNEPDSSTPDCYPGFEYAMNALEKIHSLKHQPSEVSEQAAQPCASPGGYADVPEMRFGNIGEAEKMQVKGNAASLTSDGAEVKEVQDQSLPAAVGVEPSEDEMLIACLEDDAAKLKQSNPDDEMAATMLQAAERIAALSTPPASNARVPDTLSREQIEQGWRDTFSTNNPFCPCDLNSFTKAVRWAERQHTAPAAPYVEGERDATAPAKEGGVR